LSTNIEHPSQPADGQPSTPAANIKWYTISWRRPSKRSSRLASRCEGYPDEGSVAGVWAQIESYKERMGWTAPWYSSFGSDFNVDFGVTTNGGETFGLSVFLRDGDSVYRTYFTSGRGAEALGSSWTFLDLTPLGRQETWEDSPAGWPQTAPYEWWRRHDEYEAAVS
jgi:uncharacterized protein DUF899